MTDIVEDLSNSLAVNREVYPVASDGMLQPNTINFIPYGVTDVYLPNDRLQIGVWVTVLRDLSIFDIDLDPRSFLFINNNVYSSSNKFRITKEETFYWNGLCWQTANFSSQDAENAVYQGVGEIEVNGGESKYLVLSPEIKNVVITMVGNGGDSGASGRLRKTSQTGGEASSGGAGGGGGTIYENSFEVDKNLTNLSLLAGSRSRNSTIPELGLIAFNGQDGTNGSASHSVGSVTTGGVGGAGGVTQGANGLTYSGGRGGSGSPSRKNGLRGQSVNGLSGGAFTYASNYLAGGSGGGASALHKGADAGGTGYNQYGKTVEKGGGSSSSGGLTSHSSDTGSPTIGKVAGKDNGYIKVVFES